jgi:hypothetical protein
MKNTAVVKRWQSRCCHRRGTVEWLKHPDMEYVVDVGAIVYVQAVGDRSYRLNDLKWPNKAWTELATEPRHQGLRRSVKNPQQHLVVDDKLQRAVTGVVVLFGILLGLQQVVTDVC